jgi:hypothetical protein
MGTTNERIVYPRAYLMHGIGGISRMLRVGRTQIFGVPPQARRAKPFLDHILTFSILDSKIWFRNFQVRHHPIAALN